MSTAMGSRKNRNLPPLLRLLTHAVDFVQAKELEAALPVARRLLADVTPYTDDSDSDDLNGFLEAFIKEQVQRSPHYARAYAFVNSDDFPKVSGGVDPTDVFVAYADPSVALGVAIAYVLLADRGSETGTDPKPHPAPSSRTRRVVRPSRAKGVGAR